jgi:hypothetical protein
LVFGVVLLLALVLDLGLLSKKGKQITIRQALLQTLIWVLCLYVVGQGKRSCDKIYIGLPDGVEFEH